MKKLRQQKHTSRPMPMTVARTGNGYEMRAFVHHNGVTTNIAPAGSHSRRINNAGDSIGTVGDTAALFMENGVMKDLMRSDASYSEAVAINNAGQIVGNSSLGAYVYQNGNYSDWRRRLTRIPIHERSTSTNVATSLARSPFHFR